MTAYYLQATPTQTASPVVRRNTQMMYHYLGGSVPMRKYIRPFACTDPTYTTKDFLNAITANMVMAARPEQTDSPFHEAWILKRPYVLSREYIDSFSTATHEESPHFPIYLQIKKNYFKVQPEKDLHLPVSYYGFKIKALLLENMQKKYAQQKLKHSF